METRKVQVTGKSTFVVSLPKRWVTSVKLRSGDSVAMSPLPDGTMLIDPKLSKSDREQTRKSVMVDGITGGDLFRKFIGVYLAGYNVIEFRGSGSINKDLRQEIRVLSHSVIGPQIIEESANVVVMKDLLDTSDFSMVKGIRRMYLITKDMHQDAINVLNSRNIDLAEDVEVRDEEVDKLFWMISKQYNLILRDVFFADKMGLSPQEALGYLLVARSIERIADHARKLALNAKAVMDVNPVIPKIAAASNEIIKLLDEAMNAFYQNKFEYADSVVDKAKMLSKMTEGLTQEILGLKGDASNIVPLAYIVDSLERTRSYAEDIAEIAINHHFVMDYNQGIFKQDYSK